MLMKIVGFHKIHNFDISWPESIFVGFSNFITFFLNQVDIQEYSMAPFLWPKIFLMAFPYIIFSKKNFAIMKHAIFIVISSYELE